VNVRDSIEKIQEYVDRALNARESRRLDRESGKYSLSNAMATPINTIFGVKPQKLREIGDKNEDVCFANITTEKNESYYIGKFAIYDSRADLLVCSWKAPIAALFYRSNIKDPLGLAKKCRIIFDHPNHVKDLEEVIFKELQTRVENLTKNPESDVSDAVLDELEKGSSGSLKEIVKTIHASQYEIISAKRGGLHIIQGAPGTGKTVVGVHRASWLLFPGNDAELKAEKTMIVGPNIAFIRYIENVVPSLGDETIVHKDLTKLGPTVTIGAVESRSVAKLKGDIRMKALILQAIKDRLKFPEDDIIFNPPGHIRQVALSAEGISIKMSKLVQDSLIGEGKTSYSASRSFFKTWLLNSVNSILKENFESEGSQPLRNVPFLKESDIEALVERIWPSLSPATFLRDFYSSQGRIINAARDLDFSIRELMLLERKSASQLSNELWTLSDVALLDFLAFRFYGPDQKDLFEYIIVDEAQDLTPMQLESIKRRSENGDILLMGDLAQATGPWVYSSWNQIALCIGQTIERFDELEFGYRVPKQIFEYATRVLSHIDPELKSPRLVRDVNVDPELKTCDDFKQLVNLLIEDLKRLGSSSSHIGLIIADSQVELLMEELKNSGIAFNVLESNSLAEGLNIIPVSRQKGLEFDDVIIVDPRKIIEIEEIGLRQLYVSVTRSLKGLWIYSTGETPRELLESNSGSKLHLSQEGDHQFSINLDSNSDFFEIKHDVEGYLRVKGLTLREFIVRLSKSNGGRE